MPTTYPDETVNGASTVEQTLSQTSLSDDPSVTERPVLLPNSSSSQTSSYYVTLSTAIISPSKPRKPLMLVLSTSWEEKE